MTDQLLAIVCLFVVGCASVLPPTSWTFKNQVISNTVNGQCQAMCVNAVSTNCVNDCEGFAYYSQEIGVDLNEAK